MIIPSLILNDSSQFCHSGKTGYYSHAGLWFCQAVYQMCNTDETGNETADKGYELIKFLSPAFHAEDPAYKTEPMYMAADIYTNPDAYGRGGWSIYTGAAAWYYKLILMTLLGITPKYPYLELNPKIPSHWQGFEAQLEYYGTKVKIKVIRQTPLEKEGTYVRISVSGIQFPDSSVRTPDTGHRTLLVDGIEAHNIPLDGKEHDVELKIL